MGLFRRRARVRLQLEKGLPTFEGIRDRRRPVGGHYLLITATVLEQNDDGTVRTVTLDHPVEVPADRVVFVEVLGR